MTTLISIAAAYLLGSIPFGLLAGRLLKGIDVREHGSKSTGATNVFRTVGKIPGIAVLILDALKGVLACFFPLLLGVSELTIPLKLMLGVVAIMGHTFPVWLKFKGGKGVATSLGVFLAVCWKPTLITFALWILTFALTHIISISSLVAAVIFPIAIVIFYWGSSDLKLLLPIGLLLAGFIFYTHRANIKRLREGNEKRLF